MNERVGGDEEVLGESKDKVIVDLAYLINFSVNEYNDEV